MAGTTARGYPYPDLADPANVPSDIQALAAAIDADVTGLGTWAAYAGTWSSTGTAPVLGNGTLVTRQITNTDLTFVQIALTMGSTTTFGTGNWTFSLPATSNSAMAFAALAQDTSSGNRWGGAAYTSSGIGSISRVVLVDGTTGASATSPFTWASTDFLLISGAYERV